MKILFTLFAVLILKRLLVLLNWGEEESGGKEEEDSLIFFKGSTDEAIVTGIFTGEPWTHCGFCFGGILVHSSPESGVTRIALS